MDISINSHWSPSFKSDDSKTRIIRFVCFPPECTTNKPYEIFGVCRVVLLVVVVVAVGKFIRWTTLAIMSSTVMDDDNDDEGLVIFEFVDPPSLPPPPPPPSPPPSPPFDKCIIFWYRSKPINVSSANSFILSLSLSSPSP